MADLGNLLTKVPLTTGRVSLLVGRGNPNARTLPYRSDAGFSTAVLYKVAGRVTEEGLPVRRLVRVYEQEHGIELGRGESDAETGEYEVFFYNYSAPVTVVVYDDPDSPPPHSAIVNGNVVPVPAEE